ncbi:FapA family protein [Pseudodesulfovibrio senegalensis]|uniref:DUF342 domain-containing protein n=1 Tax=Pseudodesulfovibrio senegalensis TaxID=1721087 RepID=A0A6N6N5A3_9BACT|nr:FapA family protein [Pseudodesulfovibrio senegalensis]KAB1442958.1 DUF342 domain-containing protein [Pseudodesulfovibrio senegalensis]
MTDETCTPIDGQEARTSEADAKFRFCLSEDGMKLGVSRYQPPSNNGAPPSTELIKKQVAEAGVTLPVDEDAAQKVLACIESGKDFKGIALVRGIEMQEPQDASFEKKGDLNFPVFPGDCFAVKTPPVAARNGQTINGVVTKPKSTKKPKDITITVGENCEFNPSDGSYTATVFGMARVRDDKIQVDPLLRVDKDNITISCTIFHQDFSGKPISVSQIEKELLDLGVVIDMELEEMDRALRKASIGNEPVKDVLVVRGRHPVNGKDGWLEYLVSTREQTGTEDESGRLDFKDRGAYPSVDEGQTVARLHPPTKGQGGIDIFGKTVPANEGRELFIHLGENVILLEDEITFQATARGILVMERNTLSVSECLVLSGNVDMGTGNVRVDTGSVKVLGNVQAGFEVRAPKHVVVGGSIESATVVTGGNVEVSGGILMPDGGLVEGGDVITSYMNNGRVLAHGNIVFKNEISNSNIQAFGKIIAEKGKGIIQGGTSLCSRGMTVNELGSELGVKTVVGINLSTEDDLDLIKERKHLVKELNKIDKILGKGDPRDILTRTPADKREAVVKIIKHRMNVSKRYKNVTEELTEKADMRQQELAGISIKVMRTIHAGVIIKMGGQTVQVKKTMDRTQIHWNQDERKISFGPL